MGGALVIVRVITSDTCIREGAEHLARIEPRFAAIIPDLQPLPLRLKPDGFAALLGAIVSQQVSVASANAIMGRLVAAGMDDPRAIALASAEDLRALGLSAQKARYAKALALADLDYPGLHALPNDAVIAQLTQVTGIGVWTAEIYAMFSLGRADVFAPGDLALQEAARVIFDLPDRPRDTALRAMAQAWAPWRSVAARVMWAYYAIIKDREGIR
ncbi:DNA-3-methyladenine glycosylase family protein [Yoonia vestfoldensis]|uniref:DNA-3-methyladenine glycosylase II n=1 Tax=Yoonia vestfoldensis SKA53 TaxID=314232 RepID=A3V4F7_9RHOB|nr:DNA-3-methyladenine glycosylase [Yoonia vestfoldensis]EAQ07364.1 DNA-3-methyladenine glycosylase II, putative [Yoonia vestfoldensis SKA53]